MGVVSPLVDREAMPIEIEVFTIYIHCEKCQRSMAVYCVEDCLPEARIEMRTRVAQHDVFSGCDGEVLWEELSRSSLQEESRG